MGIGNVLKWTFIFLLFPTQSVCGQIDKLYFDNYVLEDGLSDNYINNIFQDSKGWIWIGTGMGIQKFDGIKFKTYPLYENDSVAITGVLIRSFFETSQHQFFVGIEEYGLGYYNSEKDRFERFILNGEPVLTDVSVKDIAEDKDGNLWTATKKGICKIDLSNEKLSFFQHDPNNPNSLSNNYVRKLRFDENSKLWLATRSGLDRFNPKNDTIEHYSQFSPGLGDDILELYIDRNNLLWVGTYSKGIFIFNTSTHEIEKYIPDKNNERSFKVFSISENSEGKYWIGTRGGLYLYDKQTGEATLFENLIQDEHSLVHNSVQDIFEDAKGDLWIGTRGGLSHMVTEKQVFKNFKAFPNDRHYLNNEEVYSIWANENEIWIGTESGGANILNRSTGLFEYLTSQNGLSKDCIKSFNSLGDGKILIGTFEGGLNIYDTKTRSIEILQNKEKDSTSLSGNSIWDITIDKKKNIWLGTSTGLDRFDYNTKTFIHYPELYNKTYGVTWIEVDNENDLWISSSYVKVFRPGVGILKTIDQFVRDLMIDSKGRYWLMTNDKGIVLYDKKRGETKVYDEKSGIANNSTFCMLEDNSGKLWISTSNGLSCFNPETETFHNYYNFNGLQGNQFHYGAAAKTNDGELVFGGKHGVTIFNTANMIENNYIPPVYFTDFKIFNQSVKIGQGVLHRSIMETDTVEIPFKYNIVTFEFASLNYVNSEKNKYKYYLEGFDNEWTETNGQRSATYTNLDPGEYVFKVIASNDNGFWNNEGASKVLIITPPFYWTIWFISVVVVTILSLTFLIFVFIFKRREVVKTYELEKKQVQKLHELDSFKLKLFTNISHEIKTPLTLIITPLKKILQYEYANPEIKDSLYLMEKNARQLMNLITQLLDYRKLHDGKLKIDWKRGDIVRFSKNIFMSFKEAMDEKRINYTFRSVQSRIVTDFDTDKLRKILNNLISNAIKYNQEEGIITFFISMIIDPDASDFNNQARYIKIEIQDTGQGIEEKELPKVFKRFYSKTNRNEINSSGIGLAFTKELIELHNGKIYVESKPGKGSLFSVLLPFIEDLPENVKDAAISELESKEYIKTNEFKKAQETKKVLLVVEDNLDVIKFIKGHFHPNYIVLEALNGNDGLDIAVKSLPDVIISDIMMPEMNGIELCSKIKTDERTSHIPVLLLTALSSKEDEKEGLKKGADDYITKPFDIDILETKIENLLMMRKSLRDKFNKLSLIQPSPVEVQTLDEKFIVKAVKTIEKYISDSAFNVDVFMDEMAVSRMQLYRKISALTNMSVKEFINDIRLKRAAQILSEKKIMISEVAYSVGFNEISYFGKCFKRKFGMTPSEYNLKMLQDSESTKQQ